MLLEKVKFLEEAIETSYQEVLEEIASIREGAEPEKAHAVIERIMKDLYESSKNFDSEDAELLKALGLEDSGADSEEFLFRIGQKVLVVNFFWQMNPSEAYEELAFPEPLVDRLTDHATEGDEATVVARKMIPRYPLPVYVISLGGRKYAVLQDALEEDTVPF